MKKKLLSICITTLNREKFLKETIDNIIDQNNGCFDLIISNGGCTDGTDKLMIKYSKKNDFIKYINPRRKIGLDEGYHICVKESNSFYSWCIPDDDILAENSIKTITENLNDNIDLLLVNLKCYTKNLEIYLNENLIPIKNDLDLNYSSFEKLFSQHMGALSYTGTIILKNTIWFENDLSKFYNSWFGTYAAMASSKKIKTIRYLSEPVFHYRSACSSWTDHSFEIWHKIWPKHILSFELFNKYIYNNDSVIFPWKRFLTLLKSRAMGEYSISSFNNIIYKNNNANFRIKIQSFFILLFPVSVLNLLLVLFMIIFRRDDMFSIYNLVMSSKNESFSRLIVRLSGLKI